MKFRLIESTLIETKQDIENFISKFGQQTYDLFNKSRDRLKNNGYSTDLIYYTKNIDKEELDNILSKLQRKLKVSKNNNNYNVDKEGIRGKYNYLGEKNGYKVYQPLDYLASVDLGYMSGWCTAGRYEHAGERDCKPSETEAKKHFEDYTSEGIELYYFLDSKTMEGKYAIAKYPKLLKVDEFINDSTYVLDTNFKLYNQADELEYNALNEIPFNIVKELIINKSESKDGLIINSDNNTLIKVCPTVTKVIIPNNITSIGNEAFYNCGLTSVTIPTSVETIGARAFYYCLRLTSITIPDSVTEIGWDAFSNCMNLTSVTFAENSKLKSISPCMFSSCRNLTNIEIPSNVSSIGYRAFLGCGKLISVSIPSSVKSIAEEAFYGCSDLTRIYYGGTRKQWNSIKIGLYNSLTYAKIYYNNLKEQFSKENKMQFKILKENTNGQLLDKVNELLKPLKIHVSMPVNIDKNGNVWLFAYSRQQSERWEEKLKAAGYDAFAFFEQGAYIVKVNLPINKDTQNLTESVNWSYYNKFNSINDKYLPDSGEGENMATQIVTAVNKLVYKWYNDGDVYDNRYGLEGWANDLSSYANWLHSYIPETKLILERVIEPPFVNDDGYENLLRDLADLVLSEKFLSKYESQPIKDSIYEANGPFEFVEYSEDDEDEYDYNYEDDYDEDYLDESLGLKEKSSEEVEKDLGRTNIHSEYQKVTQSLDNNNKKHVRLTKRIPTGKIGLHDRPVRFTDDGKITNGKIYDTDGNYLGKAYISKDKRTYNINKQVADDIDYIENK